MKFQTTLNKTKPVMKHSRILANAFIAILVIALTSCSSDDDNIEQESEIFTNGILNAIVEIMGQENIDMIENELGMVIHRGENPPYMDDITVLFSPAILMVTNVPGDFATPGQTFNDAYIRMHNYNSENYTIRFDRGQLADPEPHFGEGSYIVGEGNNFTVFGPQESSYPEGTVLSMNVFSGTLTEDGIADAFYALIMLDNAGNSGLIPNDTGRSFEDGDQFSEITEWPFDERGIAIFDSNKGCMSMLDN
jgi:hypothetical protein